MYSVEVQLVKETEEEGEETCNIASLRICGLQCQVLTILTVAVNDPPPVSLRFLP